MKKKIAIGACILAVLLAGGLWYTRPMTIQQLCPEIDLSQCSSVRAYIEIVPSATGNERLILERDSPAFVAVMTKIQSRTFSRSLTSLLPRGTRTVAVKDGDFQWELHLEFDEPVVTPDGNGHTGILIRLHNFFGSLGLDDLLADRTWDVTTQDQEEWLPQIMDILSSAKG